MPPIEYPNWNDSTPSTNENARITRYREVKQATVIEVKGATYRSSQPLDGVFELIAPEQGFLEWKTGTRAEVCCAWFGVKPPNSYPRILLPENSFKVIRNYTGKVVDNIST